MKWSLLIVTSLALTPQIVRADLVSVLHHTAERQHVRHPNNTLDTWLDILELLGQGLDHLGGDGLVAEALSRAIGSLRSQPMDKASVVPDAILKGLAAIVMDREVRIEVEIAQGIVVPAQAATKGYIAKHVWFEPQGMDAGGSTQGW